MSGFEIEHDALWPRDEQHRYRLYARVGKEMTVLGAAPDPGGLGQMIVQLHADAKEAGRRLCDSGRIGVLDVLAESDGWIIPLWGIGGGVAA